MLLCHLFSKGGYQREQQPGTPSPFPGNGGYRAPCCPTAHPDPGRRSQWEKRHRASRPAHWHTVEEPLDLAGAVRHAAALADVLLLDCITLWLSNWLARHGETSDTAMAASSPLFDAAAMQEIHNLLATLDSLGPSKTLIVITNEVGLGIVPAYPLGRLYRDTLGLVNQRLAEVAGRVYLLIAGIAVDIKRLREEAVLC